jgi:hypothetical protein
LRAALVTTLIAAVVIGLGGCGDDDQDTPPAATEAAGTMEARGEEAVPEAAPGIENELPGQRDAPDREAADPEEAIRRVLDDALASADPALACEDAVTDSYVKQAYGSASGCRAAQGVEAVAHAIELEGVEVADSSAEGTVAFNGGVYDGEEGEVRLVLEDDRWKLESLEVEIPPGP